MQIFVRADRTYTLDVEVLPPLCPLLCGKRS